MALSIGFAEPGRNADEQSAVVKFATIILIGSRKSGPVNPDIDDRICVARRLDTSFAALSDATRRGVLEQLGRADASITELADKFHMTPTGMKKHVGVLEQAGLVATEKVGRVRTCRLGLRALAEEMAWIERHRQLWDARFDALDKLVEELKSKEKVDGQKKRK